MRGAARIFAIDMRLGQDNLVEENAGGAEQTKNDRNKTKGTEGAVREFFFEGDFGVRT